MRLRLTTALVAGVMLVAPASAQPHQDNQATILVELASRVLSLERPADVRLRIDSPAYQPFWAAAFVADARPSVGRRPDWQPVHLTPDEVLGGAETSAHKLLLEGIAPGLYRLRISAEPAGRQPSPFSNMRIERLVALIPEGAAVGLSLFTDRGRQVYVEGEAIEVNCVIKSTKPMPKEILAVTLEEVDDSPEANDAARLTRTTIYRDVVPAFPAGAHTVTFRLTPRLTSELRPGRYQVTANLGDTVSAPLEVVLVSTTRETPVTLCNIEAPMQTGLLSLTAGGGSESKLELESAVRRGTAEPGFSLFSAPVPASRDPRPGEILGLLGDCPALPVPEAYGCLNASDCLMQELLRHGITALPASQPYEAAQEGNASRDRLTALYAQAFRRWPNFAGLQDGSPIPADIVPTTVPFDLSPSGSQIGKEIGNLLDVMLSAVTRRGLLVADNLWPSIWQNNGPRPTYARGDTMRFALEILKRYGAVLRGSALQQVQSPGHDTEPGAVVHLYQAESADGRYILVVNRGAVTPQSVKLPEGASVVYDVLEGRQVRTMREAGGQVISVDLRYLPGRLYLWLPEPISGIQASRVSRAATGQFISVAARVLGASGKPISAHIPLEVTLSDPYGRIVHHLFRVTDGGSYQEFLKIGVNEPSGKWLFRVQELVTGHLAEGPIDVIQGSLPWAGLAEPVGDLVFDLAALGRFPGGKRAVTIPLEKTQAACRPLAERLARGLGSLGIKCAIKSMDEAIPGTRESGSSAASLAEGTHLVDGPLILLGIPGENSLLDAIIAANILLRQPSPNYPGVGRGLVEYAWSPFNAGDDAVVLVSNDSPGLERAVDAYLRVAGRRFDDLAAPLTVARNALLPLEVGKAAEAKLGRPLPMPVSLPQASTRTYVGLDFRREPCGLIQQPMGPLIQAVAASPDGEYLIVAGDSCSENLLLFDAQGREHWRVKIEGERIGYAAVAREASFAAVATQEGNVLVYGRHGTQAPMVSGSGGLSRPVGFALDPEGRFIVISRVGGRLDCLSLPRCEMRWTYQQNVPAAEARGQPAQVALSPDGSRLAACMWPRVTLLDTQTGQPLFEHAASATSSEPASSRAGLALAVSDRGDVATTDADGDLVVLSPDGEPRWRYAFPDPHDISDPDNLSAYEVSRRVAWGVLADGKPLVSSQSLRWMSGGELAVLTERELYVISPDGVRALVTDLRAHCDDAACDFAVGPQGELAVSSWDGKVYRLDGGGGVMWQVPVGGSARLAYLSNGRLAVGTSRGRLISLDPRGNITWETQLQ